MRKTINNTEHISLEADFIFKNQNIKKKSYSHSMVAGGLLDTS